MKYNELSHQFLLDKSLFFCYLFFCNILLDYQSFKYLNGSVTWSCLIKNVEMDRRKEDHNEMEMYYVVHQYQIAAAGILYVNTHTYIYIEAFSGTVDRIRERSYMHTCTMHNIYVTYGSQF